MPVITYNTYEPKKQAEIRKIFMELFRGNDRRHGVGKGRGVRYNDAKGKYEYTEGNCFTRGEGAGENEFQDHLTGVEAIGNSPLMDDGTCWRVEIDVDVYDLDYIEVMERIVRSKIPYFMVNRTKSGGLRIIIFFSEPVKAEIAKNGADILKVALGFAKDTEVFPKQTKIVSEKDSPSWSFLPYGPTFDAFSVQCGMNKSGNPIEIDEYVGLAMERRISEAEFNRIVAEVSPNKRVNNNGGESRKRNTSGRWEENGTREEIIDDMFQSGPLCLWHMAKSGSVNHLQHDFLFDCATFLKRKYPENWDTALTWVNANLLRPHGDYGRLMNMVVDQKKKTYEYRCKTEPMASYCNSKACVRMQFGVGNANNVMNVDELGITIYNRKPAIHFVNVGKERIEMSANELMTLRVFRIKCVENRADFPPRMKSSEWEDLVKKFLENATIVEPPEFLKTHANERGVVEQFFTQKISTMVRDGFERPDDVVRIKKEEERIYFKMSALEMFCRSNCNMTRSDIHAIHMYVTEKGLVHGRTEGRAWWRSTCSFSFKEFDEDIVFRWLNGKIKDEED